MKPQSRIFDILFAFCWVMIVVTGSLALGSYWSRRPVSSLQPQSSAAPAAPLPPELSEALPDTEQLISQLTQIAKGQFTAKGTQPLQLSLSEQQLGELLKTAAGDMLSDPQITLENGNEAAIEMTVNDPEALIKLFPKLKEYGALLTLAKGCRVAVEAKLAGQDDEITIELQRITLAGVDLPTSLVKSTNTAVNKNLKTILDKMDGLQISVLELKDEAFRFEGTVPQTLLLQGKP